MCYVVVCTKCKKSKVNGTLIDYQGDKLCSKCFGDLFKTPEALMEASRAAWKGHAMNADT